MRKHHAHKQTTTISLVPTKVFLTKKPSNAGVPMGSRMAYLMSSTLKKRRKKMNKHKLRKRRKRDRGYSKK